MNTKLPGIVITGASGFIGRHFVEVCRGKFRLFCLARRSQKEAGIAADANLRWSQVDIGHWDTMRQVVQCIKTNGGAEFVVHLAGYYDFTQKNNPEYESTNVKGTYNVLKLAQQIGTRRFLFSSSLAACEFPEENQSLTEESPPDADFPYAWSKRKGEKMLQEFAQWFPCTIIRLAAVYSDWCEYPPLYMFLETWLSSKWNHRILGGNGTSAVPYIHVQDVNKMFLCIIEKSPQLPRLCTFIASPENVVSHHELFKTATHYFYGQDITPFKMPQILATPGVILRQWVGDFVGNPPFERAWMMKYIDKQLRVNPTFTFRALEWQPTPRLQIIRRLLFLLENMKHYPDIWQLRNEAALQRVAQRLNLTIYDSMIEVQESVLEELLAHITHENSASLFPHYQTMDQVNLRKYLTVLYLLIATTVRTRDRLLLKDYIKLITHRRFVEGFPPEEVVQLITSLEKITTTHLLKTSPEEEFKQRIYDYITLTVQLVADEIEEYYEVLASNHGAVPVQQIQDIASANSIEINRIIRQLSDICREAPDEHLQLGMRDSDKIPESL